LLVAAYDPGVPQDVIDHGNDVPPSSLRLDTLHQNDDGQAFVSNEVWKYLTAQGLLGLNNISPAPNILHEGAQTNLVLRSENFGSTWAAMSTSGAATPND